MNLLQVKRNFARFILDKNSCTISAYTIGHPQAEPVMESIQNTFIQNSILNTFFSIQYSNTFYFKSIQITFINCTLFKYFNYSN